jgi:pimeloyl-ACP methyl ester carboxylesterase
MPNATINGIKIVYEEHGEGPPLLMLAPGGFDSTIEKWSTAGVWAKMDTVNTLGKHFRCIAYDRREAGGSGGRIEHLSWGLYADEAAGLLDHLGIEKAFVLGGCMGCSVATAFGARHPERGLGLLLHWPVGGYSWKTLARVRFAQHTDYVREAGLESVVEAARAKPGFWADPRGGLWSAVLSHDDEFAKNFVAQDQERYLALSEVNARTLFDRDTAGGAEPEELTAMHIPAVIIPGDDPAHRLSASHYLNELLPEVEFWNVLPPEQDASRVAGRLIEFGQDHWRE